MSRKGNMGKRFFGFTSILDKYQFSKYQYFALALVLLLGAAIRFYNLGEWSFWYDEIFTLRDIEGLKPPALLLERPSLLLSAISVSLFGVSEWSARFVPALIGVLSIPTLYFLVRTLFNPTIAILSVLLLAVSPWHLYWSQNARFYTALLLFYTLALFAFYWGIEKDRPWYLVLFMVLFGLAVRERLFALFILPVVAGYLILVKILPFPKPPGLRMRNLMIIFIPGMIMAMILGGNYVLDPSRLQL
ncbi:MAG: phospholipid carrier-dependent glycosyltransferase, partial [Chloroflexi bacterium]